ncbi:MAG: MarR family transcriptional regulator [Kineosporiaceae bacterium]|nr:MarR family transcriptional regulator [Aeromicrobium sp.]
MPTDSQNLAQSVVRLSRRLRQERQSELTANQMSVLGALRTKGPLTPGAIAAHEHVQPPSMTRTINCLDEAGLVTRGQHPDDGRQVIVTISAKGEDVLATERARRDQWLARRIAELSTDNRKVLRSAAVILAGLATS